MSELRILIVEDEECVRESVVQILEIKGYSGILEASKGQEAITLIGKEKPDIVFLDIQLADNISGMEVLKQSRQFSPNTAIVMMSAYADKYEGPAKELGAYGFLKKPIITMQPLVDIIVEITKKRGT